MLVKLVLAESTTVCLRTNCVWKCLLFYVVFLLSGQLSNLGSFFRLFVFVFYLRKVINLPTRVHIPGVTSLGWEPPAPLDGWGFPAHLCPHHALWSCSPDSLASPASPLSAPELASPDFPMGASQDVVERGIPVAVPAPGLEGSQAAEMHAVLAAPSHP